VSKDQRRKRVHTSPEHKREKNSRHEKKQLREYSSDSDDDAPKRRRREASEDDEPRRVQQDASEDEPRRRRHEDDELRSRRREDEPKRRRQVALEDDETRRRQEDEPMRRQHEDDEPRRRRHEDDEPRRRQEFSKYDDRPTRHDRLDAGDRKRRQHSPPGQHHVHKKHDHSESKIKGVDGHNIGNAISEHRSGAEQGSEHRQDSQQGRNNGPSFNRRRGGVHHMSEAEREARLRQMQADAEVHEEQRWKRLKKAADDDAKEASTVSANQFKGKNFLEDEKKSIFGTEKGGSTTIEESIRRRAYYSQGGHDVEQNAFRR
jgi:hypothetical protein